VKLFVILVLFFTSAFAGDLFDYVGIGVASQNIENKAFDTGKAVVLNAGKNNIYDNIGLELESTLQLDKPSAKIGSTVSKLKFWSMGMYGTYLWKIDDITIKPRLGLVYESIKSSFNTSNTNPLKATDTSKVALSGGIGISYNITNKTKLYTNYTKLEDDIDHITFGAEFRF